MAESPASQSVSFTEAQQDAMRATGQSILVSAAAGSGKTSVLAERCVYLVADARPACDIDQMLVVTFTEAAAGEMRARIERALASAVGADLASPRARHLARQLTLLGRAQISTIHGFCSRLIRQNFHLLGLDPQFAIIEQDGADLLLDETVSALFEESYVHDRFRSLIDLYGSGSDAPVIGAVVHIYQTLRSVVDPAAWRAETLELLQEAAEKPLAASRLGIQFAATLNAVAQQAVRLTTAAERGLEDLGAEEQYCAYAGGLVDRATRIAEAIEIARLDLARDILAEPIPRQPSVRANTVGGEQIKQLLEPAKNAVNSKSQLVRRLALDPAAMQEGMRKTLPFAQELLQLVDLLEQRYSQAKREANALDFSDLERLALQLLRDPQSAPGQLVPSAVARACHERFRHVLVDEYQDINDVQDAILRLASTECLLAGGRAGNLFCVGDVKQSIYRFRLARPELFTGRAERFGKHPAEGRTIHLRENFRSRAGVLETVNAIFERLMSGGRTEIGYGREHALVPMAKYPIEAEGLAFTGAPVDLYVIDEDALETEKEPPGTAPQEAPEADVDVADAKTADDAAADLERSEREARYTGKLIREMLGYDGSPRRKVTERTPQGPRLRDIEPGDIVILLRTARGTANVYVRQLLQMGVLACADSRNGFFDAVEVSDMVSLLEVLDNQQQDIPLAAVLRGPVANLPMPEDALARIRLFALQHPSRPPFHEAVALYAQTCQDELAAALQRVLADLARWRQLARQCPVDELIWTIYQDTGYLVFCAGLERGNQRIGNLMELHRRARDFATCERQGLFRFLQMMHGIAERSDIGEAAARAGRDTVRIMTVHASKGLEFPVVILPDLARRFNLRDARSSILLHRDAGLALEVADAERNIRYNSLASILVGARIQDATVAEELRTLYVALTRAKEHLVLLGSAGAESLARWLKRGAQEDFGVDSVMGAGCTLQWLAMLAGADDGKHLVLRTLGGPDIPADCRAGGPAATTAGDGDVAQRGSGESEAAAASGMGAGAGGRGTGPASAAIERISYQYPQAALTLIAASASVTGLSKGEAADRPSVVAADEEDMPIGAGEGGIEAEVGPSAGMGADRATSPGAPDADQRGPKRRTVSAAGRELEDLLPAPGFLLASSELAASAADRGTATHAVLEHLNFAAAGQTLDRQVAELITSGRLTAEQAKLVDLDSIRWLLGTELGELLRVHQDEVLRELPFYFSAPAPAAAAGMPGEDPMDRIMVRGRLDAIVPTDEGLLILDYKTDRTIPPAGSPRRVGYQKQCGYYRQAIERMGIGRVAGVRLVFLSAQAILDG